MSNALLQINIEDSETGRQALSTQLGYIKRGKQLIRRFESEKNEAFDIDNPSHFLHWFQHEITPILSASSRRQYRASLQFFFDLRLPGSIKIPIVEVKKITQTKSNKTSSKKKKFINDDDLQVFFALAQKSRSNYIKIAVEMILASIHLGLRPVEWFGVNFEVDNHDKIYLNVLNAKNTHGRAHGRARKIYINENFPVRVLLRVRQLIIDLNVLIDLSTRKNPSLSQDTHKADLINTIGNSLNLFLTRIKMKGKFTLYSARHQFAANLKSQGYSEFEIAALMGHISTETAKWHYGKKRKGNGERSIEACEDDVQRVIEYATQKRGNQADFAFDDSFNAGFDMP